jgi:hypothetical protein
MTATDWMVVVGGIAAIVWGNWYFFLAEGGTARKRDGSRAGAEGDK